MEIASCILGLTFLSLGDALAPALEANQFPEGVRESALFSLALGGLLMVLLILASLRLPKLSAIKMARFGAPFTPLGTVPALLALDQPYGLPVAEPPLPKRQTLSSSPSAQRDSSTL